MKQILSILLILACSWGLSAQVTQKDYDRADSTANFGSLVYNGSVSVNWQDSTHVLWYSVRSRKGTEYKMVNADANSVSSAFDTEKLCAGLNKVTNENRKPYSQELRRLRFSKDGKDMNFEYAGSNYKCDLTTYKVDKLESTGNFRRDPERYWNESDDETGGRAVDSPDQKWSAYVQESNVFIRDNKSKKATQLSFDGSPGEYYSTRIYWSPDSKYLAVNKIRKNEKRILYFVESSPKTQLQPILQKRDYLKPGDALPIKKPCLFSVDKAAQIPVDSKAYENQFDLSDPDWAPDSKNFTFEFNQRGHQLYQVVEVDAATGSLRNLIEEKSKTFVEYSGKHYRYDLNDTKEIIWMSERDGWNHLYLIDKKKAQVKNQITKGEWVVREVVSVNEKDRSILFKGSGKNAGEDPYNIHYYKVKFDGSGLVDLTPEPFEHQAVFSNDNNFLVDTYSSPKTAPVTVLRNGTDGKLLNTLEIADIDDLLAKGWKVPEVFTAKARDGKTDIWGNIYYPTNFDPSKKYPVIEYIYAGPQGAFVAKSFRATSYNFSGLAELGFIIVSIDGMGTSYRSKAFQDVCYKNLKDAGFPDRILWMQAAAATRPSMDLSKVGIFGGSAGGQNAAGAVLFHPEFYKAAVASCGCHDNRMDKMWWNEQWMGYPIGKEYAECSNVVNAYRLEGDLMLMVGEMDDNVDPASTMQVADALIKAKKDFELVVLPGMNHTGGGTYGEGKRRDFFVRTLLGQTPPNRNKKH
jgi:dipeptidyl aminopeptidase/acylaminoacyl peptidase